jgi:hypothetical protein
MFEMIKHAIGLWRRKKQGKDASQLAPAQERSPADEFDDTHWHGDHWANLLTSPLDARHYVLEDWSSPTHY